jgi:hypothetical protein
VLAWLKQAHPEGQSALAADPIFRARHRLTFMTGVKTNDDYLIYDEIIDAYLTANRPIDALKMAIVYGELMRGETIAFQDRYAFSMGTQRQRIIQLMRAAGLVSRTGFLEAAK